MTLLPGAECSQLLSLEKVTWLWIPPCASPNGPPCTITTTTPFFLSRPSHSLLSSQRSFSPPSWSFFSYPPSSFSAPIRLAQRGVANSLRSANFHTFPAWDANTSSVPHSGIATLPTNTDTHAYKTQFSTPARPHTRWAFSSERTGVAYVTVIAE